MDDESLSDLCTVSEFFLGDESDEVSPNSGDRLSVVVIFDRPFDAIALDEALFSLAIQDYENLEVVLVLPDCGTIFHEQAECAILAQSWSSSTQARVVSVVGRTSEMISASLLNAGMEQATGRYIAFLHHQDLVYQHAYASLIQRLASNDCVAAFGGVRVAEHTRGYRHWMVTAKENPKANLPRFSVALDERAALHSFVLDRSRIEPDYVYAPNSQSRLAVTMFLARLALHEKADFELAGKKMVESRRPPDLSTQPKAGWGRLPSADAVRALLAGEGASLRPDAVCVRQLFSDVLLVHGSQARLAAS